MESAGLTSVSRSAVFLLSAIGESNRKDPEICLRQQVKSHIKECQVQSLERGKKGQNSDIRDKTEADMINTYIE